MVGVLPASIVSHAVDTFGLITFDIPLALPVFELDMAWHPRYQADLTHAWLRQCVRETVLS